MQFSGLPAAGTLTGTDLIALSQGVGSQPRSVKLALADLMDSPSIGKPLMSAVKNVISMTTPAPGSPAEGDRYIVPAGSGGVWTGQDNKVAVFTLGAWHFLTPYPSRPYRVQDLQRDFRWTNVAWVPVAFYDLPDGVYFDGSHDDGDVFTAFINAVPPGSCIRIPRGRMVISGNRVWNNNVSLIGEGYTDRRWPYGSTNWLTDTDGSVFYCTATTGAAIMITMPMTGGFAATKSFHMSGVCFIGPGSGSSTLLATGTTIGTAPMSSIWSGVVLGNANLLFAAGPSEEMIFQGLRCRGGGTAIQISGYGFNNNLFDGLEMQMCSRGFDGTLFGGGGNTFINGISQAMTGSSFVSTDSGSMTIADMWFENPTLAGGDAIQLTNAYNCSLLRLRISDDENIRITGASTQGVHIRDCVHIDTTPVKIIIDSSVRYPVDLGTSHGNFEIIAVDELDNPSAMAIVAPWVTNAVGQTVDPVFILNGDLVIEKTSNTLLTFKLRGTDGILRSGTINLS